MKKYPTLIITILVLLLAACAPVSGALQTPTEPAFQEETPAEEQQTPTRPGRYPEAVHSAIERLAETQNIEPENVTVVEYEQVNWPTSCLGLGEPGEMCLQVITPGWRIKLQSGEQTYVYHTDETGDAIRRALTPVQVKTPLTDFEPGQDRPQAVQAAVEKLSQELDIEPEEIEVQSAIQTTWSDSCLGLGRPDELCLQVITPGWEVILSAQGRQYELHTDEDGTSVRLKQSPLEGLPSSMPVIQEAQKALAERLGLNPSEVELLSIEQVDWSNACLDLARPDEMCAMVITPGYRILLEAQGQQYELHTDLSGDQIRLK